MRRSTLFAVRALPVLLEAALEVRRHSARIPIHQLPALLRERSTPLPARLRRPDELAALADRLAPMLPPRRLGPCLRKSLILLILWARCGLDPRLHLGARKGDSAGAGQGVRPDFHAWVSAGERIHGRGEHQELWSG
jgi:hypothetical protein